MNGVSSVTQLHLLVDLKKMCWFTINHYYEWAERNQQNGSHCSFAHWCPCANDVMVESPLRWDSYLKFFCVSGFCEYSCVNTSGAASSTTVCRKVGWFLVLHFKNRIGATLNHTICVYSSCLSNAASGLSDGNEGNSTSGGRHEGRSMKRHQRRSVRRRSRHDKTTRAKLNVLSVCTYIFY